MKAKKHCKITKTHNKIIYKCILCSYSNVSRSPSMGNFNRHFLSHMETREYSCAECSTIFNRIDLYKKHIDLCGKVTIDYRKRLTPSQLKLEENVDFEIDSTSEKPYVCLKCSTRLSTFRILRTHYLKHSDLRPFQCDRCLKTFTLLDSFRYHQKSCKVTTTDKLEIEEVLEIEESNLPEKEISEKNRIEDNDTTTDIEEDTTVKEKDTSNNIIKEDNIDMNPAQKLLRKRQYKCTDCQTSFQQLEVFNKHIPLCGAVTEDFENRITPSMLKLIENKDYERDLTNEKPFKCLKCFTSLSSFRVLRMHYIKHTDLRPFKCNKCEKTFGILDNFRYHIRKCDSQSELITGDIFYENLTTEVLFPADLIPGNLVSEDFNPADLNTGVEENKSSDTKVKTNKYYRITLDASGEKVYRCMFCPYANSHLGHFNRHKYAHMHKRQYKCFECRTTFDRSDLYKKHFIWCNTISKEYKKRGYLEKLNLKEHEDYEIDSSSNKQYKCLKCFARLASFNVLRNHYFRHTDLRPFECNRCQKSFAKWENLKYHLKNCKRDVIIELKQEIGDEGIDSENKNENLKIKYQTAINSGKPTSEIEKNNVQFINEILQNHHKTNEPKTISLYDDKEYKIIKDEHDKDIYVCLICDDYSPHVNEECFKEHYLDIHVDLPVLGNERFKRKSYKSETADKLTNKTKLEPYTCHICGKNLSRIESLKHHIRLHTGEAKKYNCPICQKVLASKSRARWCAMKHMNLFKTKCHICQKQFVTESDLKVHISGVHMIQRIQCGFCEFVCKNKRALVSHVYYKHQKGGNSAECPTCGKVFGNRQKLRSHLKCHSGQVVCDLCGKRVRTLSLLKEHVFRHKNERNFECEVCHKKFVGRHDIFKHKKIHKRKGEV